jgi:hypothetical protein
MSLFTDQRYLKHEQYKTAANLGARIALHRRFSANPYGWQHWVFDQFACPNLPRSWNWAADAPICGLKISALSWSRKTPAFSWRESDNVYPRA